MIAEITYFDVVKSIRLAFLKKRYFFEPDLIEAVKRSHRLSQTGKERRIKLLNELHEAMGKKIQELENETLEDKG